MLIAVGAVLSSLILVSVPLVQSNPIPCFAGRTRSHRRWFRKKQVMWFNGFPGWPKLPLVQRLRASPSASAPVVSSQPDEEEGGEPEEDPEPLL